MPVQMLTFLTSNYVSADPNARPGIGIATLIVRVETTHMLQADNH